ncbi:MAG: M1 family metallopeptidase [Saprospiraceae bacterium]|nr:M1 family metallopeptidase [Saprospiraceae bacterium]
MKFLPFLLLLSVQSLFAQNSTYTFEDTLRGSVTPQRAWWDLTYYDLNISVDPSTESIKGHTAIQYTVLENNQILQVDLQPPLKIDRILQDGVALTFEPAGRFAYFVRLQKPQRKGASETVTVFYSGNPRKAKRAPWDGGFSWSKDKNNLPFIATSCQGLGSSAWWPCKDHMYDEPDSMRIAVTTPAHLMDVSNGRLRKTIENADSTKTYEWFVANPINNYGVNVNIAQYAHFSDTLHGEKGVLTLDYYVLPENLEKAKVQFQQGKQTIRAFEYWFGPYPFYEDGYKLVEVPYLGMEHQSSVTYGNKYKNGYLGSDMSGTGWGSKWDYIIIHESGHEWFANNVTYKDIADMWIHESFTTYSEALFTEYYYGKQAGAEYAVGLRRGINNRKPIIGDYDVNAEGSGDMYPKGANMLHTIRQIVDNDQKWREILRGINRDFYHQIVETKQIEDYISKHGGHDFSKVFDQYLRNTSIPMFEYKIEKGKLQYRWMNCIEGFNMPLKVSINKKAQQFIYPSTEWQTWNKKVKQLEVDPNFYVRVLEN